MPQITRPLKVSIVTTLIAALGLVFYLSRYRFDVGTLVGLSDEVAARVGGFPEWLPRFPKKGHDGGYVWVVAENPFRPNPARSGHHFERWLLPFFAWAFSLGGNPALLVWAFPILNIFATAIAAYFSARLFQENKTNPWWTLCVVLGPGSLMALRFNLVDQFSLAAAIATYFFFQRGKAWPFFVSLACALLSRPTTGMLLLACALICELPLLRLKDLLSYAGAVLPLAFVKILEWQQGAQFQKGSFLADKYFGIPLLAPLFGLGEFLQSEGQSPGKIALYFFTYFLYLGFLCGAWFLRRRDRFGALTLGSFSLLALSLIPKMVIGGPWQVLRFTPVLQQSVEAGRTGMLRVLRCALVAVSIAGWIWFLAGPSLASGG